VQITSPSPVFAAAKAMLMNTDRELKFAAAHRTVAEKKAPFANAALEQARGAAELFLYAKRESTNDVSVGYNALHRLVQTSVIGPIEAGIEALAAGQVNDATIMFVSAEFATGHLLASF
jgi:hypothetical protein